MPVKHSPGPWTVQVTVIRDANGVLVTDTDRSHLLPGQAVANANLIGAATDMEELLALAIVLFEPECKGSMTAGWQWLRESIKVLKDARSENAVQQGSTESGSV
jgi:hypothetical protein